MSDFEDRLREVMRDVTEEDAARTPPPPSVWAAIEREIELDPAADQPPATVHQLPSRTRRATTWALGAAAATVLLVGAFVVLRDGDGGGEVIAMVDVTSEGLEGAPTGLRTEATIEETDDGRRLEIDASAVSIDDDEFLELWLINGDITDMVSLGMIRPGETYEIPDDVALSAFPIIDVSIEPADGDPTHSGRSVLRGRLDA